ncbi:hypothetical protein [Streptomyces cylindrosporus]|uniref:ABA 3 protein n=1 Tax=Streptomyces cylindrosporus TaxID=2927583 RepID=A0ABS9Y9N5_9ACTN|nr:hypothetical protein [Streptomyces cylindrosporus]MCI3273924.1 hypothetical protein [Streptomyces cylindrosporus]
MAQEQWFYPDDLKDDFQSSALPPERRAETLAHTWEYNRCVVPEFTNWDRYIALARLGGIAIVAEVFGDLVDVLGDDPVLGYDIDVLLDTLFGDSQVREPMAREYRASLLLMTEKSTGRRDTELMRRYVDALAHSPQDWFRLRDCDGMFRFYVAAAIACNDDDAWLTEDENRLLTEIGEVLYDAVAFHKHRAEGEIHNTYAYAGGEIREDAYGSYRQALWDLDTRWSGTVAGRCAVNFARFVGGPIHQMMRRYRFVEDGLMVGKPETSDVVAGARHNAKLWYRFEAETTPPTGKERYEAVMDQADRVLFPGMAQMLNRPDRDKCPRCRRRDSYGAEAAGQFGGVELCEACRSRWGDHLRTFSARATRTLATTPNRSRPAEEAHVA